MIEAFHFLRPWWLAAYVPAGVLLWVLWRVADTARQWRGIVAPHLLPHLLSTTERTEHIRPLWILGAIWFFLILALAGPAWQREPSPFADDLPALMLVLKASPTMDATDIQPSRIQRAVQKAGDLVAMRTGARIGLVAYAGSDHLVMPMTKDAEVVMTMMREVSPAIMPRDGDVAAPAVQRAGEQLARSGQRGSILLIADSVTPDQIPEIEACRKAGGVPVHVYAVAGPATATASGDGPSAPPLDIESLRKTARAGGGELVVVTPDDQDVQRLADVIDRRVSISSAAVKDVEQEQWKDAGYGFVPLLVVLGLFWSRPGWSVRWPGRAGSQEVA